MSQCLGRRLFTVTLPVCEHGVCGEESKATQSTGHTHSFLGPATRDQFGILRSSVAALRSSQPAASIIGAPPPHLNTKCRLSAVKALLQVGWAGVCQATAVSRLVVYLIGIYVDHIETSRERPQPRVGCALQHVEVPWEWPPMCAGVPAVTMWSPSGLWSGLHTAHGDWRFGG